MGYILVEVFETDADLLKNNCYHHQAVLRNHCCDIVAYLAAHDHREKISDVDEEKVQTADKDQQIEEMFGIVLAFLPPETIKK